jgi:3-hydroxyisobutyrate dehydrogenase-like beta-hydroxyacid dehydrogenase
MGSAVGAALVRGGARVVCTLAGRSERTVRLAGKAALECLPDLDAVLRDAEVVLSIVPPEAAEAVAAVVASSAHNVGAAPLIVDLNAIAPATAQRIAAAAGEAGCDFVDGSISGPPPRRPGTTRIYLSGPRASEVARLGFEGVGVVVVGDRPGTASAVKMSTASVYKGTTALLAQALRAAEANGVLEHVLADLRAGAPELVEGIERRLASAAAKSGRFVGEMREIADAQSAAGLTPALFEALAEVYGSIAETAAAKAQPESIPGDLALRDVLEALGSAERARRGASPPTAKQRDD